MTLFIRVWVLLLLLPGWVAAHDGHTPLESGFFHALWHSGYSALLLALLAAFLIVSLPVMLRRLVKWRDEKLPKRENIRK